MFLLCLVLISIRSLISRLTESRLNAGVEASESETVRGCRYLAREMMIAGHEGEEDG